jgi:MFS family permease
VALCSVGTVTVALSGPTRRWRGRSATASVTGAGPLRARGMLVVLVGASAVMFGFGVMEVAVPAFAGKRDSAALSGVLLATWALGSCVGGIWFGTRRVALPLPAQWRWGLLLLALGLAPLAFASNPWVLGALLFVAGTAIAPMMTVQNGLVADLAPGGTTTEAFTWLTTVAFGASAIGAAVGGLVVDLPVGVPGAFVLATLSGMLAWTVALVGRRRLNRPEVTPDAVAQPALVATATGDVVPRELCLEGRR